MLAQSSRKDIDQLNRRQAIGAAFGTFFLVLGTLLAIMLRNIIELVPAVGSLKITELVIITISIVVAIFCFGTPALKLRSYQKTHRKLSVVYPKKEAITERKRYGRNTTIVLMLIILNVIVALLIAKLVIKQYDVFVTYPAMITPLIILAPILSYNGTRLGDFSDALKAYKKPKTDHKIQERIGVVLSLIALVALIFLAIFSIASR